MKYNDLRDFLRLLEQQGELKRIALPVDPYLEMTDKEDLNPSLEDVILTIEVI